MNKSISFYDPQTGLFDGRVVTGPERAIKACVPEHMAFKVGRFDHLSQKVDLQTGEIVDYQPAAPLDDDLQTWAWNPESKRWVSSPTTAAHWEHARGYRNHLLTQSDWMVTRAADGGPPVSAEWAAYRQALRDITNQPDPLNITWPTPPSN